MKYYGLNELREKFLAFFESKGHLRKDSFSLVPSNDKSLLLINSGMAPLKPYFTGKEVPPRKRMTTCQKCIRTGDIENVGKTARHGTFFEMLGNFSFGDYFKEDAIKWAWEFFTKELEIPKELLYVSVYEEDDEAAKIWHEQEGVPKDRIVYMGKADNFWEHGLGPCGPCSEIYIDRGEKYGCGSHDCKVGCECDRYVEVWNLVFTQFELKENGEYEPLDNPNIDTGMGLERLAVMMQDVDSIFDVDTIVAIENKVCELSGKKYKEDDEIDVSIRLITDHVRSITFMASDGIMPSNEGRGYVFRRLLRRASHHGKKIGIEGKFLTQLVDVVIETSKGAYSELEHKKEYITNVISMEEDRFAKTIDNGMSILLEYIDELKSSEKDVLDGEKVFVLHDTYGFPVDLTREILEEKGLKLDLDGYKKNMEMQRERARKARGVDTYMGNDGSVYDEINIGEKTVFEGYDTLESSSEIICIVTDEQVGELLENQKGTIFVKNTPFYATSGGQVADKGVILTSDSEFEVKDVKKIANDYFAHIGTVVKGSFKQGDEVQLKVEQGERRKTMANHSATHLLQQALRDVLGKHVEQAGSHVNADRLRFDFTHFSAMTDEQLEEVEKIVNDKIMSSLKVDHEIMGIEEAKTKGAMALFGEKYGDEVRVISMGDYSVELCGGTHVSNTNAIGLFKIVAENGIAAGVRRIEAITGKSVLNYYKEKESLLNEVCALVKSDEKSLINKTSQLIEQNKKLASELEAMKAKQAIGELDSILKNGENVGGVNLFKARVDVDFKSLEQLGDNIVGQDDSSFAILCSYNGGKVNLLTIASKNAVDKGIDCGKIIRESAKLVGGGGGGRKNIARAGGKDESKIEEALSKGIEVAKGLIK